MSSDKTMTNAKVTILNGYFNGFAPKPSGEGCTEHPMTTDDIIDELAPMATFTQEEIIDWLNKESYVCEKGSMGLLRWRIFDAPDE